MGNLVSSFLSGFGKFIDKLFGSPLDFLAGKSCSSICGSTWNFICYIENFCVVHLLKLAAVSVLFYFVLLFFYLLYKLGICQCICRSLCKMAWACFATCFSVLEYGCSYLCYKLPTLRRKQRRHERDFKEFTTSSTDDEMEAEDKSFSYHVPRRSRRRDYKGDHLRRSLRPRSHRIQVGIIGDSTYASKRNSIKNGHHGRSVHDVRVTRTSKFAQKSGSYKGSTHRMRRRK